MKKIVPILIAIACFIFSAVGVETASAADRGTEAQAKALVAKAIAAFDAKGKSAFAEMTAPSTSFVDRDLYIFVIGPDHKTVAHGAAANRVGLDVMSRQRPGGLASPHQAPRITHIKQVVGVNVGVSSLPQ
jgi:cytochrome c